VAGEKILIIGPESPLNTLTRQALPADGFQLFQVEDQEKGQEIALVEKPDLLLLQLPVDRSTVLLKNLVDNNCSIPTILVSEQAIPEIPVDLLRLGVRDCLTCPLEPEGILQAVERILGAPDVQQLAHGLDKINRKLEERLTELNTLFKISRSVSALLDLDQVLNRVTEAAVFVTGAEEGYLLLLDEDTGELLLRAAQNLGEKKAQGFTLPVSDSIAGEVVRTGQPIMLGGDKQNLKVKTGYLVKSLLNVPLKTEGRVIGVLGVDNQVSDSAFTFAHLNQLSLLADMATAALENAQQHTKMRQTLNRQVKEFTTLQAITDQLGAVTDFDIRARLALSLILNTINAEAGVLAWAADTSDSRYISQGTLSQLTFSNNGQVEAERWWNNEVLNEVVSKGQPILKNNFLQNGNKQGIRIIRSRLAVPMRRGKQVVGAINLESSSPHVFTQQDLHFVSSAANQVAIALEETIVQERADTDRERLLSLMSVVDSAVWLVDTDLKIVAQNDIATEILGWSSNDTVGQCICDQLSPDNHSAHELCRLITQVLEERHPVSFDSILLSTKDNNSILAHGKVTPIVRENEVAGVLCTFHQISAETSNDYVRLEFANMASHLLRTPLSFIQMSIDLLMNSELTPEERQLTLDRMWEQSRNVTTFTDELLDMLRLEAGDAQVYIEPVSLPPLLERVVKLIRHQQPELQFNVVVPDTLPMVAADSTKTELILYNLLTNAINRCSDAGCITIESQMDASEINIVITDNGQPIPEPLLDKVFEQFYPIDDNGKMPSTYQLGLYSSKRLVELQNGQIWAKSKPNQGFRVGFSLPIWKKEKVQ
jgi:PAS domain S-box-containing protein